MSSKAGKMEKQIVKQNLPEKKTKTQQYRIDVELAGEGIKTTYVTVTGIPEDLPEEYENTIRLAAESQFANAVNERKFLEFYSEGKSARDEQPRFINLAMLAWIQIKSITKVTETK